LRRITQPFGATYAGAAFQPFLVLRSARGLLTLRYDDAGYHDAGQCCNRRLSAKTLRSTPQVPLAALPDGESKQFVTHMESLPPIGLRDLILCASRPGVGIGDSPLTVSHPPCHPGLKRPELDEPGRRRLGEQAA
jgi:hypothetical protein